MIYQYDRKLEVFIDPQGGWMKSKAEIIEMIKNCASHLQHSESDLDAIGKIVSARFAAYRSASFKSKNLKKSSID